MLELVTKIDGDTAVDKFEVTPFTVESTESERIATECAQAEAEASLGKQGGSGSLAGRWLL